MTRSLLEKRMRRRIALISEHASPLAALGGVDNGGQNVYVAQVAKNLAAMGYEVDVFTRRDNENLPEILEWESGIRIIHVPAGPPAFVRKEDMLPYMDAFTDYVAFFIGYQARPYDLIHANFFMSGMVAAEIKRRLNIPFVITFHALGRVRRIHQNGRDGFSDERFTHEERIVAEADRIIAECPQDQEDLINLYDADPALISIAPCGFDPEEMWPIDKVAARRHLKLPVNERIILQLGRMVPRKGVDNAIRGLARLIHTHKIQARLIIVGGESDKPDPALTPELGRLLEIARQEGVENQVEFLGRKPRQVLRYYYGAADIFISTPWYEPFGITPVESMACGTPVIGSNVGGIKYSVVDGQTGFLVLPEDPDALGERLAQLYSNPDMMRKMRKQAVARANQYFTWKKVVKQLVEIYEEVIAASKKVSVGELKQISIVEQGFFAAQDALQKSRETLTTPVTEAAQLLIDCFSRGNKVLVCGNGGSAADSLHFASELVGRFKIPKRQALPVLPLTADIATLTAWSNDVGFEKVFARQVEAFGQPGDILFGISTTGRSKNLIEAFTVAHDTGITNISLLGGDGGDLLPLSHLSIVVPATDKQRVQEVQILILHLICELVEEKFGAAEPALSSLASTQPGWELQPGSTISISYQQDK